MEYDLILPVSIIKLKKRTMADKQTGPNRDAQAKIRHGIMRLE